MASTPFVVVAGTGPGTGASVARKFAKTYPVVLLSRTPANFESLVAEINQSGGKALGYSADVTDAQSISDALGSAQMKLGTSSVAAAVFNASPRPKRVPFLELSPADFRAATEGSIIGSFNFSQAVLPLLLNHVQKGDHPPTLIFTGATASVKANPTSAMFATGKFAVRALSHSLGKEFGPRGVHVALAIIDGVIDIPLTAQFLKDAGPDAKISSSAIADAYWHLHTQPRSCFTNELDIRPHGEKW